MRPLSTKNQNQKLLTQSISLSSIFFSSRWFLYVDIKKSLPSRNDRELITVEQKDFFTKAGLGTFHVL